MADRVLHFPGSPSLQAEILERLAESARAGGMRFFLAVWINPDGTTAIEGTGEASFLEQLGLLDAARTHLYAFRDGEYDE